MENKNILFKIVLIVLVQLFLQSSVYGANFSIVSNPNADMNPAVAYNSTNDEYLVVYEYAATTTNHDIWAKIINTDGSVRTSFLITNTSDSEVKPKIAYNSTENQYMIVWEQEIIPSNHDIKAKIIDANGSTVISTFNPADWLGTETDPDIAYNSTNNQYMVVWVGGAADNKDIYGRIFDASGNHITLPHISLGSYNETSPSVTYNPSYNNYLVLWHGKPPSVPPYYFATYYTIYGSIVTNSGTMGAGVTIVTLGSNNFNARAVWNPTGEYLVVMEQAYPDGSVVAVKGQRLNGSAAKLGSIFEISDAKSPYKYGYPAVDYNAYSNEYLVAYVYSGSATDFDIYCRQVGPGGTFPGNEFSVAWFGVHQKLYPNVVYGNGNASLMVWQDDRNSGTKPDIYGEFRGRPEAVTEATGYIATSSGQLRGYVTPNGRETTYYFQYGQTTAYGSTTPVPAAPAGSGTAALFFYANISGLLSNTDYHCQIVAQNDMGQTLGSDQSFHTLDADPTIVTTDETNVGSTSVTLNGAINPNGTGTDYYFRYGQTTSYGRITSVKNAGSGRELFGVSENLTGLLPNQTYHFMLMGRRGSIYTGYQYYLSNDKSFTTAPVPPSVLTGSASSISQTSATLSGTVNPNGAATTYSFQYGTTIGYGSAIGGGAGSGTGSVPVSRSITGLTANTTYHYRLMATNAGGTTPGDDLTFTTLPPPPSVSTGSASSISQTSATLSGTVYPNGAATTYSFQYGLTVSYGSAIGGGAGSGTGSVPVSRSITGLTANTTYHYRLIATNAGGTTPGDDLTFTTLPPPPSVSTGSASSISQTSATLKGTVYPHGAATTYYFQYGLTDSYGSESDSGDVSSGTYSVRVVKSITGLTANATYHYRLIATNAGGTTPGDDWAFTTLPPPYESPLVNGIDQTLQKLGTTESNIIHGGNFMEESTVSMFLDGGNERDILATLNLSTTASTVAANQLWLNSNVNELEYYSLQNPAAPVLKGIVNLGGQVTALTSDETCIYAAYDTGSSHVVQRINAATRELIPGTVTLDSQALDIEMGPGVLWVLTENRIYHIDPGTLGSGHFDHGFDVISSIPYAKALAVIDSCVCVVGKSDDGSTQPAVMRIFQQNGDLVLSNLFSTNLRNITFINNSDTALVATSDSIIVMDFSKYLDPDPIVIVLIEIPLDIGPRTLLVREDLCYVAGEYGLEILDISDPENPQKIGYTYTPETCSLALFEDVAYLTNSEDYSLTVVDVATPSRFQAIGTLKIEPLLCCPELLNGRYFAFDRTDLYHKFLFAVAPGEVGTDDDKLYDVNVSNPEKPEYDAAAVMISCPDVFRDIACSPVEDYLALAYGPSGIYIQFYNNGQDFSGWYDVGLANVLHTLVDPEDGTKLWVADETGIFELNVARGNPAVTLETEYTQISGITRILKITPEYIYAARNENQEIIRIRRSNGTYFIWDMWMESSIVWKTVITSDDKLIIGYRPVTLDLYTQSITLFIYDISGDNLVLQSTSEYAYPFMTSLSIQREELIFITSKVGLTTIDISDAEHPVILSTQKSPAAVVQAERDDIGDIVYTFGKFGFVIAPLPDKIATTYVSPTELQVEIPSPKLDGNYTLRVHNGPKFTDLPGAITFTDVDRLLTSKAIIVAGRNSASDPVWPQTQTYAAQAYENLRFQGYAPEDIVYLTADGAGVDVDGIATNASLQAAIEAITDDGNNLNKDLLLYLVGHGGFGTYQMNASESLDIFDLDGWLDTLQANGTSADNQVVVISDACHSGSSLRCLKKPAGTNRIVIASSDADQAAYFLSNMHSFSAHLWASFSGRTGETVNLSNGYWQAADMMVNYQTSWLDVDGDGVPNEQEDVDQLAALEEGHLYGVRRGYSYRRAARPTIASVFNLPEITGTSTTTLEASGVYDADGIDHVYAVITPPGFVAAPDQVVAEGALPRVELVDLGSGDYEADYTGFTDGGSYIITYYAEDINGLRSLPWTSVVKRTDGTNPSGPDVYENDDSSVAAKGILPSDPHSQFHTFHILGDKDWAVFYVAAGDTYNVRVNNVSAICNPAVEIYAGNGTTLLQTIDTGGVGVSELDSYTFNTAGRYYLRVTNSSGHWGSNVSYCLRLYNPIAFSYDGKLSGQVTDNATPAVGLLGAALTTNPETGISTSQPHGVDMNGTPYPDGYYVMGLMANSYTVNVVKEPTYLPDLFGVTITTGNDQVIDVQLAKPNTAPVISQGSSVSASMSEDGSPTAWSAPTVSATDADGGTLTWSLSSGASHGTATVSGTGSSPPTFIFSPAANYYGSDSFVVRVSDGTLSDTITVNVTIDPINDAPTAVIYSPPSSVNEDTTGVALSASGSTDVDGDTITYFWEVLSGPAGTVLHDANTDLPTFDPPNVGPTGGDITFQLTVDDGDLTATAQCTIAINWVPYVDVECIPADVNERQWVALSVTGDPDATIDTITVEQPSGPLAENWDSVNLTFTAPNVNWTQPPADMDFNVTVEYLEGPSASAEDTCTVTVYDIIEDFDHDEDIDGADLADFIFRFENHTLPSGVDISTFAEGLGQ